MKVMKVLFLNHRKQQCGVYQYGIRLYDILRKDKNIEYIYREITSLDEYRNEMRDDYGAVIYNYHVCTMTWLNRDNIQRRVKNIGIPHESPHDFFDIIGEIDPTQPSSTDKFPIPRPIYENVDEMLKDHQLSPSIQQFISEGDANIPRFGSFGFGFLNKGFDKIVTLVNNEYDEAIIKFVMPFADFADNSNVNIISDRCNQLNVKPWIKLMITHEFYSVKDLLYFLRSNTMNIFLYDKMEGRSISSTIDSALSVGKPFGISDSSMFRNIYSDDICLYKRSIKECMNNSLDLCRKYLDIYSNERVIKAFNDILTDEHKTE